MRPVVKGVAPQAYVKYTDAQPDLIWALGRFCSYCGRSVLAGIHVEHKRPQKLYPHLKLKWDNFLLACANCNSAKKDRNVRLSSYLWPDVDNTLRAFTYHAGGLVRVSKNLPKRLRRKASRTLQTFGLHEYPGGPVEPSDRDYRWQDRREEWDKAVLFRTLLRTNDTPRQRDLVVAGAQNGIFSIWWTVFEGDVDMRRRLRMAFQGTDPGSFDVLERAKPRVGGQV